MPTPTSPRRGPRRMLVFAAAAVVVMLTAVVALAMLRYERIERLEQVRVATEARAAEIIARTDSAFAAVPALAGDEASALRTYRNPAHLEAAERYGVDPPVDRAAAEALVADESLVAIEDNRYFRVESMDHSVPYVTPDAQNLLTLVGRRFQEALAEAGLPPYRYVITSGTRTLADQKRLRGVNVNAAAKSSHWFGTTVDLHYARFDYPADVDSLTAGADIDRALLSELVSDDLEAFAETHDAALKAILGRVLREMQRDGRLLTIYERRQPVYHITVASDAPAPDADRSEEALDVAGRRDAAATPSAR